MLILKENRRITSKRAPARSANRYLYQRFGLILTGRSVHNGADAVSSAEE